MNRTLCILAVSAILYAFVYANLDEDEDYGDGEEYEDEDFSNLNSTSNGTLVIVKGLTNITRDPGKTAKIVCEVQNLDLNSTNKVTFIWRINEVPVTTESNRIKVKNFKEKDGRWRSVLRISKLEFFDQGFIECVASNGVDRIKSSCALLVNPESYKWAATSAINSLKGGSADPVSFDDITTFLPNSISKLGEKDYQQPEMADKSKTFSAPIQFDLDSTGKLTDENIEKTIPYNATEPFCQVYQGGVCNDWLAGKYVFVQPPYTQGEIENKLFSSLAVISRSNDISQSCSKFAQPSICFSAFPLCLDSKQINEYQRSHAKDFKLITNAAKKKFKDIRKKLTNSLGRICRDECMLLETELCSKEYSIAKRHPVIGQIMELEVCENLPVELDPSSAHCVSVGVGDFKGNKDEQCYWDTGKLYRGVQNTTMFGEDCLKWSHQFHLPISDYPELAGHNYCRNPGDTESEPFCYVKHNRKELCGIQKCVYVFGTYVIAILLAISLFAGLVFVYCYCKRRNKVARNLQNDLPQVNKNIYGSPGPSSPIELNSLLPQNNLPTGHRNHNSNKIDYQNLPQYTYKEVRFIKELGEGAFGKVYQGELKTKMGKVFVAVKSLKENASEKTQADFQREIELISLLKHPNIICLLGVVMRSEPKMEPSCMLFEYMSEGDLHEFLIANSPENAKCLSHDQFLDIAIQIAQGMEYLSGNHYVHRDLAARNCLVSKDLEVKISDFGLSRDMYSCDYYRVQSKSLLPVRWMPPESILYGKFTTESDVWSYGVVLWEIYSYGLQPYYGYNNQEVISMIRSRKLLPCPDSAPSYCYALMVECWAEQANRRPNFAEITERLKVWKQSGCTNGAYFKSLPPSCQPTPHRRCANGSKSSHTSDSQTLCVANDNPLSSLTWEREHPSKPSSSRHDSQSSLTSRCSSLGNTNTTQSTNISLEGRRDKRPSRRNVDSLERPLPKHTVVNSSTSGDNFETKIRD
ncbi:tyrosine-protein kinase transmembrane receptor Ror-like isoform X2 [Cylas formicarius]|uniref:tyrosine-protein kinase transmembrane receptor Ror-like isoform X2 n=1 Tax=Cylas formicarius TaxID=197179 RepID=UPI0029588656|nr:tyrosine-protein kinase transmembrane receptor Ror-like isoform X2 [Cylas formicarius]